jgi:phage repressor protein C with HTH and peptisase S24 domain
MYQKEQQLAEATAILEHMEKLPTRPRLPKNVEGDIELYYKGPKRKLCQERPIICNFADYDFSVILKSNRMIPKFEPGDELFFKETDFLKDEDGSSEPEWGDEFLLDTKNGLRFKRIYPAKDKNGKDCFRCVSYNKDEYPDFLLYKKLVRAIYRYVGALRVK